MALNKLESLVLRGVSVLCDGQAVELCRGASEATVQTPEVRISMRHPSLGNPQANPNSLADRQDHDVKRDVAYAAIGAGRSRSRAGVLSRRSPALLAGRTTASRWSTPERLSVRTTCTSLLQAWCRQVPDGWSPEQSVAGTTGSPFTGATSYTAPAVAVSTWGTGVR
jgi:hypothetical protein